MKICQVQTTAKGLLSDLLVLVEADHHWKTPLIDHRMNLARQEAILTASHPLTTGAPTQTVDGPPMLTLILSVFLLSRARLLRVPLHPLRRPRGL